MPSPAATLAPTRRALLALALLGLAVLVAPLPASGQEAVPTRVMVRALAHDAKLIGSGVGGARIVIQEAETGRVLAEGVQEGATGETQKIMVEPHARGASPYTTEGAAGFLATLDLVHPTVVDITAYAPLATPHAMQRTTKRMLLVPGKDVLGEGILLELNGFTVELLAPAGAAAASAGTPLPVRARVTMLCGCPTEPGGLWDADRIDIQARLLQDGRVEASAPLSFTGATSEYEGTLVPPAAGAYTLEILASDPERANFGRVQGRVAVR